MTTDAVTPAGDLERRGRRVQALREHQPSRLVQAQGLLVLQRAHGRQRAEMMVEGRGAHVDLRSQVVDAEGLGEIPLQPLDGPGDLMALASRRCDLAQPRPAIFINTLQLGVQRHEVQGMPQVMFGQLDLYVLKERAP